MDIQFGSIDRKQVFHDGKNISTRTRYEVRKLVYTSAEELTEFVKFRKENHPKCEFRIEPTISNNGWYIVKSWEE